MLMDIKHTVFRCISQLMGDECFLPCQHGHFVVLFFPSINLSYIGYETGC